jgi:hypothetical protein
MERLQIYHDEPFLSIGPDARSTFTWAWLKTAAEKQIPIQWDMMGETRLIPVNLIVDAWRVVESYLDLIRLGRGAEAPQAPWGFVWQQTVPFNENEAESTQCNIPPPPPLRPLR